MTNLNSTQLKILATTTICRNDERYTSFPDVVCRPDGVLLAAFRQSDQHYPPTAPLTELILIESHDRGRSWVNQRVFDCYPEDHQDWGWHCARLSLMSDGRICLICDLASVTFQKTIPYILFSSDGGLNWSEPINTNLLVGIPDRLIEFGPEHWGFAGQWYKSDPHFRPYSVFCATEDSGKTWQQRAILADKQPYQFCEPSIARLKNGRLQAYLRENSFLHYPTFVCHSDDFGYSWSEPQHHRTNGHRCCAALIDDKRVLVSYRNIASNPGLSAWLGTPEDYGWRPGGKDLSGEGAKLSEEGLIIETSYTGSNDNNFQGVEYTLMPLRDLNSSVKLSACVKCLFSKDYSSEQTKSAEPQTEQSVADNIGAQLNNHCVIRAGAVLEIHSESAKLYYWAEGKKQIVLGVFAIEPGVFHDYQLSYDNLAVSLTIDGLEVFSGKLAEEPVNSQRKVAFGNRAVDPAMYLCFKNNTGSSVWRSVQYSAQQSNGEQFDWSWQASSGTFPNHYAETQTTRLNTETSSDLGESGYSGWTSLGENQIYLVDYRRGEAPMPYIVGYLLELPPAD